MTGKYTFEFYPLELFKETISGERRVVFVCLEGGRCRMEEKHPEFRKLLELFDEKCNEGYEVTQVLFQDKGVLVLYKKLNPKGARDGAA